MTVHAPASPPSFTAFSALAPGRRHSVPGRSGEYFVEILPFGRGNCYAHAFFREPDGPFFDSLLLLPNDVWAAAGDGFPIDHLTPATAVGSRASRAPSKPQEVLDKVRAAGKLPPTEARPDEKDPEAVQSPAEADAFNRVAFDRQASKELVEATLAKIFGNGTSGLKPGSLVDSTFLGDDQSLPLRQIVYFVTPDGRPILQSFFDIVYGAKKQPLFIVTRTLQRLEVEHYRKVLVEETLKSSSLSAGLNLALSAPTLEISSGPRPGDQVHDRGSGTGIGFDFSFVRTFQRLRIEAELKMQDRLGAFETTITVFPPIPS